MAEALVVLHGYTGDADLLELFDGVVMAAGRVVDQHPSAVGHLLAVLASAPGTGRQVAVVGVPTPAGRWSARCGAATGPTWCSPSPTRPDPEVPLLAGRVPPGDAAAFVCREMVCDLRRRSATSRREPRLRPLRPSDPPLRGGGSVTV